MIHFVVPAAHERMMREYLEFWGRDVAPRARIVHTESLPAMTSFPRGTWVLAGCDQLGPHLATYVEAWHEALASQPGIRFLNTPTGTLQRFDLLRMLHARGTNRFRAVRITEDYRGLRFPVFVRDGQSHDGALSPLLTTHAQVEAAIGRVLLHGATAANVMVVEFCDTADGDGYYRKYSAFVVGPHIIPRSLSYSREWMLKFQGSEFSPRMAEEERAYVLTNPHEESLRTIFEAARVGYGRIDYAMLDGCIQTWEVNLNPTIGRGLRPSTGRIPPEVNAIREHTKGHFYAGFRAAWEDVDLGVAEEPALEPSLDAMVVDRALSETRRVNRSVMSMARRALRPVKPLLEPVLSAALPTIARVAIRRASRTGI